MNYAALPPGYQEICRVDLANNRRQMLPVLYLSLGLGFALLLLGLLLEPLGPALKYFARRPWSWLLFLLANLAYILLHELTHGIMIRHYSGRPARLGFSDFYAYAASDHYFNKRSYLVIALAPVLLWGFTLLALNICLPRSWFWFIYPIQIFNFSGAAGDFYLTCLIWRLPKNVLVYDSGAAMRIYARRDE